MRPARLILIALAVAGCSAMPAATPSPSAPPSPSPTVARSTPLPDATAALTPMSSAPASAAPSPSATAVAFPDCGKRYSVDVQAIAAAQGISCDEALAQMNAQEALKPTLAAISEAPDIYLGTYLTHTPDLVFHVVIKQGKTPTVALPPSTSVLTVVVEVSRHSAADFKAIEKAVLKSGILFSTMGVNIAMDRLDITVPDQSLVAPMREITGPDANITVGPMGQPL